MSKKLLFLLFVVVFAVTTSISFADISYPTTTKVYFTKDGKPFNGKVEYTVNCYGYVQWFDSPDKEPGSYIPESVYSYSATCPSYGCEIDENYYHNYTHIDYCDLTGKASGQPFEIKNFAKTPAPECKGVEPEDDSDDLLEIMCEARFDITKGIYFIEGVFNDVSTYNDYYDSIKYVKDHGIVAGYPDGSFKPSEEINRAEFTKIILGTIPVGAETSGCKPKKALKDAELNAWYSNYVCAAVNNNIIDGYPDGTFKPSASITFTEAAKIIVEALKIDYSPGDTWYEGYVKALRDRHAIPINVYELDYSLTRGDMAEIIYRILANVTNKPYQELL